MILDAYVKMDTCDCGYFRGDETFDVHAASSLQEFRKKKKHEVLAMTLKAMTRTTAEKQVHLGTRIEAARNCFRLDCWHPHFCSLHCIQLKL